MTDTPKFTPGPWMVSGVRAKIDRHDTHSILRYDAEKKRDETIASVWYDPKTDLGRADAHLIAAAPDLYAALEEMSASLHQTARDRDLSEAELEFMRKVDALLAKARGQA